MLGRVFPKRTDEVTALEVEAVQLVAGLLRIHDVVIDNKGGSLGIGSNALADLAVIRCQSRCRCRGTFGK